MSIANYSLIVAIDANNGISKNGYIPWKSRSDMKFFKDKTVGNGKNIVIMGRRTYESIPEEFRPLEGRHNIVISTKWRQSDYPTITVADSLTEALKFAGGYGDVDEVFVAGGERVYNEAIARFLYRCKRMYITKFKTNYECDQFFDWDSVKNFPEFQNHVSTRDFNRYYFSPNVKHDEDGYLETLRDVLENGKQRIDRTDTGTISKFGVRMEFDISESFPLITTKTVKYSNILKELLWMMSGDTDSRTLEAQGVNIWRGNSSRRFLDERGLKELEEGDIGCGYGFQWRHWGAEYEGCDKKYDGKGVDQIAKIVDQIRNDPFSRRIILSAWNVDMLDGMALPPCHMTAQFYVSNDRKTLDCQLYQRSGDMFLGVPYNIASYSTLTYMLARICNLKPGRLIHVIGDAHIYSDHVNAVKKQLKRDPKPFPTLKFSEEVLEIDDFEEKMFELESYEPWPFIQAKMAV